MIKDLFEQLKSKFEPTSNEPTIEQDSNSPITQFTTDKIKAVVAELANAKPLFSEAGFVMEQLEIEVGLIPKVTSQFVQLEKIPREKESELLTRLDGQKLLKFILQSLFKSSRMDTLMETTELSLHAIEIDVSVPPSVRTIFKRKINTPPSNPSQLAESIHPVNSPADNKTQSGISTPNEIEDG